MLPDFICLNLVYTIFDLNDYGLLTQIFKCRKRRNMTQKNLSKPRSAAPCRENVEKSFTKLAFVLSMQLHFGESFKPQILSSEIDVTLPFSQDVAKNIKQTSCYFQPN